MTKIMAVGEPKIDESMFTNVSTGEFTPEEKETLARMIPGGQDLFALDANKRKGALLVLARKYYSG